MPEDEREVRYVLPKLWRFLLFSVFVLLFLNYDPAGISSAGARWMARVINYIGAPQYESAGRDKIVVVLADPVSLDAIGQSWPLPYAEQAEIISIIMEHKPRMLALDLLFTDQRREDPDAELLWNTINEYRNQAPIFGAVAPPGKSGVRLIRNAAGETLPVYGVDVAVTTKWPDLGYRLKANSQPESMAFEMYRALCDPDWPGRRKTHPDNDKWLCPTQLSSGSGVPDLPEGNPLPPLDKEDYQREMLVVWANGVPDYASLYGNEMDVAKSIFKCNEDNRDTLERLMALIVRQRYESDANCAYHAVIPIDLLKNLDWDVADNALQGKIVFYGLDHPGIPDIVDPPTTQPIAGVHLHAMALDNLMTFGPDYFGTESKRLWAVGSLTLAELQMLVTLAVLLVLFFILVSNPVATGQAAPPAVEYRVVSDFAQLKSAWRHYRNHFTLVSLYGDTVAGFNDWQNFHTRSVNDATSLPDRMLRHALWVAAFLPILAFRTFLGRILLFVFFLGLLFYLDIAVLKVPPVDAFSLIAVLTASKIVVPTQVFHPRRKRTDL